MFERLQCATVGHDWQRFTGRRSKMAGYCARCGATGQVAPHSSVRERSRRMTQILKGQVPDDQLAGGKQTRWAVQGLAARIKAGIIVTEKPE